MWASLGSSCTVPSSTAESLLKSILRAGDGCGLALCGLYALDGCRLEKGFRHWGHDIGAKDTPIEAGLSFAVSWHKEDFLGREALLAQRANGVRRHLLHFAVDGANPLLLHDEPIYRDGNLAGWTTSGGLGPRTGLSLCFGYIRLRAGRIEDESHGFGLRDRHSRGTLRAAFARQSAVRPHWPSNAPSEGGGMRSHARVVVIGGGAMGVSLLYHLAKRGWTSAVLVEKHELTAGSTWHAAGLCTHFAHNATIMTMRAHSVNLYRDVLSAGNRPFDGFPCDRGASRHATTGQDGRVPARSRSGPLRRPGLPYFDPRRARSEIYPLCVTDGLIGAVYEPNDGHVDPTLATNAMAAAARALGAEIVRHNPVRSIESRDSGEWKVRTAEGDVTAEHVVNAAGTWCREIGAMLGLDLPVVPLLHQYVVTDRVTEIADRIAIGAKELPIIRDPEESWYLRQERDGFIVGPYEKSGRPWAIDGVPADFGMELLPPDLDRVEHILALAMARVPALARAGLKTVVNGPITFTPDSNPLIGPAFGLVNAWLLTGSSMGVMEAGGAGAFLADWIIDGAPPRDPLALDPRRFGAYADRDFRIAKAVESFGLQFGIHYPYEEREAGRPRRTTPALERQRRQGAVLGAAYGWERPNWFAREPPDGRDALTFRRPGWLEAVRGECGAVHDCVGCIDLSALSKFEVTGKGAGLFLASLGANRPPSRPSRIGLTHALTAAGGVASEFTVTRLGQ